MAKLETLTDDFTTLDTTIKWAILGGGPYVSGGTLHLGEDDYLEAQSDYEFTDSHLLLEIVRGNPAPTLYSADFSTAIQFGLDGIGGIGVVDLLATEFLIHTGPLDPAALRWWKLRDESGTLILETSPDGSNWTSRGTAANPLPSTVRMALIQSGVGSDLSEVDNINLPTDIPPIPADTGRFFAFF